jgi:hypothetical protein
VAHAGGIRDSRGAANHDRGADSDSDVGGLVDRTGGADEVCAYDTCNGVAQLIVTTPTGMEVGMPATDVS